MKPSRATVAWLGVLAAACSSTSRPAAPIASAPAASEPSEPEPIAAAPDPSEAPAPSASCDETCTGSAPPTLVEELRLVAAETRGCYERALERDATLAGRLGVEISLDPGGKPCRIAFGEQSIAMDPEFERCVRAVFERSYPAPRAGCLTALVPLNFRPKQADDAGAPP